MIKKTLFFFMLACTFCCSALWAQPVSTEIITPHIINDTHLGFSVGNGGHILIRNMVSTGDGLWCWPDPPPIYTYSYSVPEPLTDLDLNGVWCFLSLGPVYESPPTQTNAAIVGNNGIIIEYYSDTSIGNGPRWEIASTPTTVDLNSVWGVNHYDSIWAVGDNGTILRRNHKGWDMVNHGLSLAGISLNDIFGVSTSDIWVVGEGGLVIHFNGESWIEVEDIEEELNIQVGLNGIWAVGSFSAAIGHNTTQQLVSGQRRRGDEPPFNHLFIAGDNGTLLYYDAVAWQKLTTKTTEHLNDVKGFSGPYGRGVRFNAGNVVIVGDRGTMLSSMFDNPDPEMWLPMTIEAIMRPRSTIGHLSSAETLIAGDSSAVGDETVFDGEITHHWKQGGASVPEIDGQTLETDFVTGIEDSCVNLDANSINQRAMLSMEYGYFSTDTIAGVYILRASKPGYEDYLNTTFQLFTNTWDQELPLESCVDAGTCGMEIFGRINGDLPLNCAIRMTILRDGIIEEAKTLCADNIYTFNYFTPGIYTVSPEFKGEHCNPAGYMFTPGKIVRSLPEQAGSSYEFDINLCSAGDSDADGICNNEGQGMDNCKEKCNAEQLDADGDGIGDVCDDTPGCGGCGGVPCEQEC